MRIATIFALATSTAIAASASADLMQVEIHGTVEYNQVTFGLFGNVNAGDDAVYSFMVDSDNFTDSDNFNVRGYEIMQSSYSVTIGDVTVGLQDPFPNDDPAYFVLRDQDPAVDGFYLTRGGVDFPSALPLDEPGQIDNFASAFSVGYTEDTLDSLNITEAAGTYDFGGLTNFYMVINDGPFEPIGMIFSHMTIMTVPAPGAFALLGVAAFARRRRQA